MSSSSIGLRYTPLTKPTQEIRLLQILPGNYWDDIPKLTLRTYSFDDCPNYVALSYEWGSEEHPYDVIINRTVVQVRQNLWAALKYLRELQSSEPETNIFKDATPKLWIDALCINQADDVEKGHQVALMGHIYRQAAQTVAWLGPATKSLALAMQCLKDGWRMSNLSEALALREFCGLSYFQRMWIVQEVIVSKEIHFVCGSHTCPWRYVAGLWRRRANLGRWGFDIGSRQLAEAKQRLEEEIDDLLPQKSLLILLGTVKQRQCTDFHDRVYALLGLIQQGGSVPSNFGIDYAASPEELMIRTGAFITSVPEQEGVANYAFVLLEAFELEFPVHIRGRVAWYWLISEVLHILRINLILDFQSLETITSPVVRTLLFQMVCWIIGGYGLNLFPTPKRNNSNGTVPSGIGRLIGEAALEAAPLDNHENMGRFLHWTLDVGTTSYQVWKRCEATLPHYLPSNYEVTESESSACQRLLMAYNDDFKALVSMHDDSFQEGDKNATAGMPSQGLPIQLQCSIFASLLAQLYHDEIENKGYWPGRGTKLTSFIGKRAPRSTETDEWLTHWVFAKFRVEFVEVFRAQRFIPPEGALTSVQIVVATQGARWTERWIVASLYDTYVPLGGTLTWELLQTIEKMEAAEIPPRPPTVEPLLSKEVGWPYVSSKVAEGLSRVAIILKNDEELKRQEAEVMREDAEKWRNLKES